MSISRGSRRYRQVIDLVGKNALISREASHETRPRLLAPPKHPNWRRTSVGNPWARLLTPRGHLHAADLGARRVRLDIPVSASGNINVAHAANTNQFPMARPTNICGDKYRHPMWVFARYGWYAKRPVAVDALAPQFYAQVGDETAVAGAFAECLGSRSTAPAGRTGCCGCRCLGDCDGRRFFRTPRCNQDLSIVVWNAARDSGNVCAYRRPLA